MYLILLNDIESLKVAFLINNVISVISTYFIMMTIHVKIFYSVRHSISVTWLLTTHIFTALKRSDFVPTKLFEGMGGVTFLFQPK